MQKESSSVLRQIHHSCSLIIIKIDPLATCCYHGIAASRIPHTIDNNDGRYTTVQLADGWPELCTHTHTHTYTIVIIPTAFEYQGGQAIKVKVISQLQLTDQSGSRDESRQRCCY